MASLYQLIRYTRTVSTCCMYNIPLRYVSSKSNRQSTRVNYTKPEPDDATSNRIQSGQTRSRVTQIPEEHENSVSVTSAYKLIQELRDKESRDARTESITTHTPASEFDEHGDMDEDTDIYGSANNDETAFTRRDMKRKKDIYLTAQAKVKQREKRREQNAIRRREQNVREQQKHAQRLKQQKSQVTVKTNYDIKLNNDQKLMLIDVDGKRLGVQYSLQQAIEMADTQGLVVMQLSEPKKPTDPVVCRLVNYGKWKVEQKQKEKARKANELGEMKMIRIMTRIAPNDLTIKVNKIKQLLCDGHPVRFSIIGRDRTLAENIVNSVMNDSTESIHRLAEYCSIQAPLTIDRNYVILNPLSEQQRNSIQKKNAERDRLHYEAEQLRKEELALPTQQQQRT